jgi:hypothetical protein
MFIRRFLFVILKEEPAVENPTKYLKLFKTMCKKINSSLYPKQFSEEENDFISGLAEIGSIGIENARMCDHLKTDYDRLITDVHHWFDFGRRH